jgi:hypothetical protein
MTIAGNAPYTECPRFDRCSVNVCPLDPDIRLRNRLPGEPRCTLWKWIRTRIGTKYVDVLPLGGLTSREAAGKRAWERLAPEEQERLRAAARDRLFAIACGAQRQRGGKQVSRPRTRAFDSEMPRQ